MEHLNEIVGENIRRLRAERSLSLDGVAKLTGVSRSMLGQIERGEVNPTISTVWRIANGLKVSFTMLVSQPNKASDIRRRSELEPLLEDGGKVRHYPVFPFDAESGIELYADELDAGAYLSADAHPPGTEEVVALYAGKLALRWGDEEHILEAGDFIRFNADVPHSYHNPGTEVAAYVGTLRYKR